MTYHAERLSVEPLRYVVRRDDGRAVSFHTNKRDATRAAKKYNLADALGIAVPVAQP